MAKGQFFRKRVGRYWPISKNKKVDSYLNLGEEKVLQLAELARKDEKISEEEFNALVREIKRE